MLSRNRDKDIRHVIEAQIIGNFYTVYCGRSVHIREKPIELCDAVTLIEYNAFVQPCQKCVARMPNVNT